MRSPHNFIVTPVKNKRYDNTKELGEVDFITSVSQEDHQSSNRLMYLNFIMICREDKKVGEVI